MLVVHRMALSLLLVTFFTMAGHAPVVASAGRDSIDAPYLELSVTPAHAPVDSIVTLAIVYHGVGLVRTNITFAPSDAISFDPPLSMPCEEYCTRFTFRTRTLGEVVIHAIANGEIFDPECRCWLFDDVADNGPAVLTITGNRLFLPMVGR